jgi:hypothetical protein
MPDSEEEGEIVVTGDRPPVDPHPGLIGGPFWFGGGGGGGGGGDDLYFVPPLPWAGPDEVIIVDPETDPDETPDEDAPTEPEIIVRPSEGQEGFADDNDPFNDGQAPTIGTVLAWLADLQAQGFVTNVVFEFLNEDGSAYHGSYTDALTGDVTLFISDGADQYGQVNVPPPQTGPDPILSSFEPASYWDQHLF